MAIVNPALPPGGLFELVFSFDTTGSMSRAIEEVKGRLQDMIQRLQADIPGIRIGLVAHGDYCDKDVFYLEKHHDLCTDVAELCQFVQDVQGTGGGDPEECYEYILRLSRDFSWTPGSQRALVLIGDATPHDAEYELNTDKLVWREEAQHLANIGIKIYGVQAFDDAESAQFFEELAAMSGGHHLKLDDFSHVCDFIMAICYRERGEEFLDEYEAEVRAREARMGLHPGLEGMFGQLRKESSTSSVLSNKSRDSAGPSGAVACVMPIPRKISSLSSIGSSPGHKTPEVKPTGAKKTNGGKKVAKVVGEIRKINKTIINAKKAKLIEIKKKLPQLPVKGQKSVQKNVHSGDTKRRFRNKVPDTKFSLMKGKLAKRWSQWKKIVTSDEPENKKQWRNRKSASGWSRCGLLFRPRHQGSKFLYEFAVQTVAGSKKNVFYHKNAAINAHMNTNWERMLLRSLKPREEIEKIVSKGYSLFMRRMLLKGMGEKQRGAVHGLDKEYIYFWNTNNCHNVL